MLAFTLDNLRSKLMTRTCLRVYRNFLRPNRDQIRKMKSRGVRWESNSRPHDSCTKCSKLRGYLISKYVFDPKFCFVLATKLKVLCVYFEFWMTEVFRCYMCVLASGLDNERSEISDYGPRRLKISEKRLTPAEHVKIWTNHIVGPYWENVALSFDYTRCQVLAPSADFKFGE